MFLTASGHQAYAYSGGKPFDPTLPTVVFIHGAQHDHSVWILQSRYLAHHGYGVLALDLPGHGRSDGPPLESVEALATWVIAVLDAAGVRTASLVGHSMGSLIALEAAGSTPDRIDRIALIGAAYPMRVSDSLLEATRDDEPLAQDMVNIWSHSTYSAKPSNPGPGFSTPPYCSIHQSNEFVLEAGIRDKHAIPHRDQRVFEFNFFTHGGAP